MYIYICHPWKRHVKNSILNILHLAFIYAKNAYYNKLLVYLIKKKKLPRIVTVCIRSLNNIIGCSETNKYAEIRDTRSSVTAPNEICDDRVPLMNRMFVGYY